MLLGRRARPLVFNLSALLAVGMIFIYKFLLLDTSVIIKLLPFSNVIVLGNWFPLLGSFIGGLAWGRIKEPAWRRITVAVPLILVSLIALYRPFRGNIPDSPDVWSDDVCLQVDNLTCGSACAASLLRAEGIKSTGPEMIKLCLTRDWGTLNEGVFRGLALKTRGTQWKPEIVFWNIEELKAAEEPIIIAVKLKPGTDIDPRYERDWGWLPGVGHTVVCYQVLDDGRVEIGDPAIGREFWDIEALKVLWHGLAFRLVRR